MNKINNLTKIEVDIEDIGERLDTFIANLIPELSRSRIQQLIKIEEKILINDKISKSSHRLKENDIITIEIPEAKPLELDAEDISLDIRYEDENMLVVNKPTGMLTHPTSIQRNGTLVNALLHYCQGNLSGINGVMRPGILHRLDKDTSGLLMIAKNDFAHKDLSHQVKEKTAIRQYLTIVNGIVKEDKGKIELPIGRHPTQRHKMAVVEDGKYALTYWKVLERFKENTFVEVTLQTGRTHQIRVHFSHQKHPVFGDTLYGGINNNIRTNGQVLQAYKLTFKCPTDNKFKTIEISPDRDIIKVKKILSGKDVL